MSTPGMCNHRATVIDWHRPGTDARCKTWPAKLDNIGISGIDTAININKGCVTLTIRRQKDGRELIFAIEPDDAKKMGEDIIAMAKIAAARFAPAPAPASQDSSPTA